MFHASRATRWLWLAVIATAALCSVPAVALAHPDLDRAIASAEEAEFDAALASFERAIASGTLTRAELITLLTERALVLHALGQRAAVAWDLANLAMIDPGHDLGRRAPPELVGAFAEASARQGARIEVHASCGPSGTGMRVTTEVSGLADPSLASIRIRTRQGRSSENLHNAAEVDVVVPAGSELLYSAELVGVGQVVLAADGTSEDPRICEAPNMAEPSVAAAGTSRRDGRNHKRWWWIGAGGAVAIAAVAVGLVVASSNEGSSNETAVGKPMVSFK